MTWKDDNISFSRIYFSLGFVISNVRDIYISLPSTAFYFQSILLTPRRSLQDFGKSTKLMVLQILKVVTEGVNVQKLTAPEISMLIKGFPHLKDVLDCLQDGSFDTIEQQLQHQKISQQRLALIALSEREAKEELDGGPKLEWIVSQDDLQDKHRLTSPQALLSQPGTSFRLQLSKSHDGMSLKLLISLYRPVKQACVLIDP